MGNDILMDVQHPSHIFRLNRKVEVHAVDDVSFQIKKGEIYGLVGESGSGKSTVARCIMNIYKYDKCTKNNRNIEERNVLFCSVFSNDILSCHIVLLLFSLSAKLGYDFYIL